ncbi:hypothetical protein [Halosimplex halophilum]|uniref:hypothetical protein n=1 Tax=Halosimplex halophilum TaxID=2559572 RepID=UPI00107F401A|nr:hypothetical protein [Halosimplex halophilum]
MSGNSTVAYALESAYNDGTAADPAYVIPGSDVTVENLTIENYLTRVRKPDSVIADRSVAQQLEGALSVSFNLSTGDFHDLLFDDTNGSGDQVFGTGHVPSAEWYMGLEFADSVSSTTTVERQVQGWVATEATIAYTTSEIVRVTLTGPYATEDKNTTITPDTLTGATDEAPFHGSTFSIDSSTPWSASLNSAELSLSNLARLVRGTSREPSDAIRATPEVQLTADADIRTADTLSRAYDGTTTATSPADEIGGVSGAVSFETAAGTVADYSLGALRPNDYDWQDLVSSDATASESVTFNVDGSFAQTA